MFAHNNFFFEFLFFFKEKGATDMVISDVSDKKRQVCNHEKGANNRA